MKNDFILQLFRFSKKGFAFHIKKILIPIKDSYTNVADKAIISTKIEYISGKIERMRENNDGGTGVQ